MMTTDLHVTTWWLALALGIVGCDPPVRAPVPSIAQRLIGEWHLAGGSGTKLILTGDGPNTGRFTISHNTLFPSTFRGSWTVRGRVLTMLIDEFPPAAQWVVPLTGKTLESQFVQDIVRIDEHVLILRVQGQLIEERYERAR